MKTLYALVLLCLSAPALAWEPESYNIACPEDGLTLSVTIPVTPNYDYSVDTSIDYDGHTATATSPASQPITDAAIDTTVDFFGDDEYTAVVTSPASTPITNAPVDSTVRFFDEDEGWDPAVQAAIEFAIQARDWW